MIVKIQASVAGTDTSKYLIYNEDRNFELLYPVGLFSALDRLMEGSYKRYFHASVNSEGVLNIDTGKEPKLEECDW